MSLPQGMVFSKKNIQICHMEWRGRPEAQIVKEQKDKPLCVGNKQEFGGGERLEEGNGAGERRGASNREGSRSELENSLCCPIVKPFLSCLLQNFLKSLLHSNAACVRASGRGNTAKGSVATPWIRLCYVRLRFSSPARERPSSW